jgi:hypothetical protein
MLTPLGSIGLLTGSNCNLLIMPKAPTIYELQTAEVI